MKILAIRPSAPGAEARFDIEISEHLRLFELKLKRHGNGKWRTYAANACGRHTASFHPELAEQITAAAVAALREREAIGGN